MPRLPPPRSRALLAGGETSNGDNLIEISDPALARIYAVNAVGLFDHFHFHALQQDATEEEPMLLDDTGAWFQDYFKAGTIHFRDRMLFCPPPEN